ncbi:unnamed protein product [Cuscuta europaea]|uniref:Uncharacterized protein n=1 Tax=Cuscuta europaea TaxID=41803 RepID=A0A9P0YPG1_CUSEU|nr:unnamed protein product [Cuscuta europaea]
MTLGKRKRSEEEESQGSSRTTPSICDPDTMDEKITELMIEVRNSHGSYNGVEVDFTSTRIWEEIARVMREQTEYQLSACQVFERAKKLSSSVRARKLAFGDRLNAAFGFCDMCGCVAHFPNIFATVRVPARSGSASLNSGSIGSLMS